MDDITLGDILVILNGRLDKIEDRQGLLALNQQQLVDSTNHKIDEIRKQGARVIVALVLVSAPVIYFNWSLLVQRIQQVF